MKIGFWGTPYHAVRVLEVLLNSEFEVKVVYTRPDREKGRGRAVGISPVKKMALEEGLLVCQPDVLTKPDVEESLRKAEVDLCVVAAYGQILPPNLLNVPNFGFLNIHPSLLPKYRGASPVASVILHEEETTGVSIMAIDKNVDAGPILAQEEVVISAVETVETLTNRLFILGANLLVKVLPAWVAGRLELTDQNVRMATYTKKLVKKDGQIQWGNPAHEICARLRAFSPWPGVYTYWQGKNLKIIEAYAIDYVPHERPGAVITLDRDTKTIGVSTGSGVVVLSKVRLEGRRDSDIWSFTQGHPAFVGSILNNETVGRVEG